MTGTLTFHAPHNYGSSLQSYALQQKIMQLGYENEIINFRPHAQKAMYSLIDCERLASGTILKNIDNLIHCKKFLKRKAMFEKFIALKLKKSDETWLDMKQTEERAEKYRAIICGSDQIWNRGETTRDRSWIYYLDFPYNGRKISYAPSMGNTSEMPEEDKQLGLIKKFDFVSVREKPACNYLKSRGINCTQVLDPTLLLDKEEWMKIEEKILVNEPYILFYSINCNRQAARQAVELGKKLGLKVLCPVLHPRLWGTGVQFVGAGPGEFLSLVHYAKFVCTNSFHGTVFSLLYEKPFVSTLNAGHKDDRRTSLLNALNLEKHIIASNEVIDPEKFNCELDKTKLKQLRAVSEEFLSKALEGIS